jgi:hypothetical protein
MNKELSPGDLAHIIRSVDGLSVGRVVQCVQVDGVHSRYGTMWLVQAQDELVTEYGGVGHRVHLPADWLKKIMPPALPDKVREKVLEFVEK